MVHTRINERETNPNPYVNFIAALPMTDSTVEEAAHQLLRALAAQVKPVMKAHGFTVNSLEEYEYNHVFAGRNWNAGETIELVLRSSTGSLLPTHWLMSTLCHELAHIKHMNHGPAFQALWSQLRQEVRALQSRGYYGDGYWSSGRRLVDSAFIAGQGIEMGDLPEYMCGGAHSRVRPASYRRRGRHETGATNLTGPQTAKKRKPGSRVDSSAFESVGKALNEDLEGESKSHGAGFRKKALSKRAREERALAAEKRIQTLQAKTPAASSNAPSEIIELDSDGEDDKGLFETDTERRLVLLEAIDEKDLDALRAAKFDSAEDFLLPGAPPPEDHKIGSDTQEVAEASTNRGDTRDSATSRRKALQDIPSPQPKKRRKTSDSKPGIGSSRGDVVQTRLMTTGAKMEEDEEEWNCLVCTLTNKPKHLACSACRTPRGDTGWFGEGQSLV